MGNLKDAWDKFNNNDNLKSTKEAKVAVDKLKIANSERENFLKDFPKEYLTQLKLEEYTNLKDTVKGKGSYFTYWLERGTETCGKFRAASSYSYGIYKVNPNNKPGDIADDKWSRIKESAENGYRTIDQKKNKVLKDRFLTLEEGKKYFDNCIRDELIGLSNFSELTQDKKSKLDINYQRKVAYLYNPSKLIPIYKKEVIEAIAEYFNENVSEKLGSYKVTESILNKIAKEFKIEITKENGFEITQKLANFLWEFFGKSFPFDSKNMILHGAPGTGKTYSVENSIKQKLSASVDGDTDKYYTLVQFHPSFGYEEFIDGIKPSGLDENGQMKFELVDGVFKKMCIDAANELVNNPKSPKNFYFIADEINRAELSRVFGEVLLCLEEDKRLSYKNGKWEGTKIEVLNSGLWTRDSQAVIVENGRRYFGVPTNIYFIGTMNDIDRSVDSFDMALRRRFLWRHYQCDYSVLEDEYFNDSNLEDYITICKALNEHIISPKGYDLGESYQLGHSYFMKPSKLTKVQLTLVWVNYIKPLLREYLRSSVSVGQIESKLKEAERIYRLPTEK